MAFVFQDLVPQKANSVQSLSSLVFKKKRSHKYGEISDCFHDGARNVVILVNERTIVMLVFNTFVKV